MWYLIYSEDVQGSLPLRKQVRPAHLARLQALQDEGRLLTAGPNPAIDAEDPADAGSSPSLPRWLTPKPGPMPIPMWQLASMPK